MSPPALYVRRWGEGARALLLHGLGASGRYWERVAALAAGWEAVAPDLLGFGRSPKPAHTRYDVADHLDALAPLLEPGTVVVGHSTGAILAAALAAREPGAVRALMLVGLPAFADPAAARAGVGRLGLLARLTVEGRPAARLVCEAMCALRPLAVAVGPLVVRDLPREVVADGARHTWASYSRTLSHVVVDHRSLPDLVAARVPTLALHGRSDPVAPAEEVRALASAAQQAGTPVELRVVEGDHHLAVRRSSLVATAVAEAAGLRAGERGR